MVGCCCISSLICIALLAVAGICTWRFGPWFSSNNSNSQPSGTTSGQDLTALEGTTCPTCCNGLESNCNLPVNEVMFSMVHNAHSSARDGFFAPNNNQPLEAALVAGYRGLMLDSCMCDTSTLTQAGLEFAAEVLGISGGENGGSGETEKVYEVGFCHTYCNAGIRSPEKVFANIHRFLESNPNEVIIIDFEINDNSLPRLYTEIDSSPLVPHIYNPTTYPTINSTWPTLQQLIDSNTRLLLFAHGDGMQSCLSTNGDNCPEGIFYTYDFWAQTPIEDSTSCLSTNEEYKNTYSFFLMNHWKNTDLDLPSKLNAELLNGKEYLEERFGQCAEVGGRRPNIIAVDFWDLGSVLEFVKKENERRGGGDVSAA
mmetsp:Transcript_29618/g.59259  ORF Transcript_29618/g.59259 Transcript_29618/m.59259 type:complete len:370 (-) Transcript_29618:135-1244(-)